MKKYVQHSLCSSFIFILFFFFVSACKSTRTLVNEQTELVRSVAKPSTIEGNAAAAQTSDESARQPDATSQDFTAAVHAQNRPATQQPEQELTAAQNADTHKKSAQSLRAQVKESKLGLSKKLLVSAALKKMEKMDVKKIKAIKKERAIAGEYRTPIIVGVVGLALMLIDVILGTGIFYTLGAILLVVAVIWILLIALEVL